mgnify:FL=1
MFVSKITIGITLIALVITIIVLLILAGVSIAILTGQNGILTQAQTAQEQTTNKSAEEKVKLAVMAARAQSEGALDADKLVAEITNNYGGTATKTGTGFPVNATVDGKSFAVDEDGNVVISKVLTEITGDETTNTTTQDSLGNKIVVPAGFEVVNPNDNVEDGIVVRDKTHANTAGSEFVWIPVGEVKKADKTTINIELNRYSFDSTGKATAYSSSDYTEDTDANHNSDYKNTIAKNIDDFKTKAESSHGYYIGRYEARYKNSTTEGTSSSSTTKQLVCTADNYVYNNVTQPQAATLSRGMYTGTPFESDLINSYAWDTATLFLQTFDNRANKDTLKVYSRQNSINTSLANQGTNILADASKQDKICNVYDMASNCFEWSTETFSNSSYPCAKRGGSCDDSTDYTSYRYGYNTTSSDYYFSFRPILYL